jgi:hypothetical protein
MGRKAFGLVRGRAAEAGLVAAVVAITLVAAGGSSAGVSTQIVPSGAHIGGHTLGQWVVRGGQWQLKYLRRYNRSAPRVLGCVTAGQAGPVWYLHGNVYRGRSVTVTCRVPAERYLLIDVPSVDCSTVESAPFHATSDAGLVRCARSFRRPAAILRLDRTKLSPPGFIVATPAFPFAMPASHNVLGVTGRTHGRAAVVALALLLRPLAAGKHTLVREDRFPGEPTYQTTFHLTVG